MLFDLERQDVDRQPVRDCSVDFRGSALAVKEFTIRKLPQVDWKLKSNNLLCVRLMAVEPTGHGTGLTTRV